MRTASLIGSVSRLSGGLFESVRRLHQELVRPLYTPSGSSGEGPYEKDEHIHISVLGTRDEFTDEDIGAWQPVEVQALEVCGPRAFGFAPGLTNRLTNLDPDLVHVHGLWQYSSVGVLRWRQRSRKPYMVSPHGMLDPWALRHARWKKRFGWFTYERKHLSSAACIRALCESEAQAIKAAGLRNPICIIPNGVDLPELGEARQAGAPGKQKPSEPNSSSAGVDELVESLAGRKVLLYLGRIHPKKGLCNLVKAWARIASSDEWVLVIAGWDQRGHEKKLKGLATECGAAWEDKVPCIINPASIVFAGPMFGAAKRELLMRCTASILPSYSEGLPMAVLEAWSHSKPVLATAQCNLPEGFAQRAAIRIGPTVTEIENGLRILFKASDTSLQEMGARGREVVAQRYAWSKVTSDLRSVYRWMLGGGAPPDCVRST
jgi:poly(glycerol-phosphate) alpha-glucosyltransferase